MVKGKYGKRSKAQNIMAMIVEWLPYFNMVFETRWEVPSDSKVMPLISNI